MAEKGGIEMKVRGKRERRGRKSGKFETGLLGLVRFAGVKQEYSRETLLSH